MTGTSKVIEQVLYGNGRWRYEELLQLIRLKISQRSSTVHDVYDLFGRPANMEISSRQLKGVLNQWGIVLSASEVQQLLVALGLDGTAMNAYASCHMNGAIVGLTRIPFLKFVQVLLPKESAGDVWVATTATKSKSELKPATAAVDVLVQSKVSGGQPRSVEAIEYLLLSRLLLHVRKHPKKHQLMCVHRLLGSPVGSLDTRVLHDRVIHLGAIVSRHELTAVVANAAKSASRPVTQVTFADLVTHLMPGTFDSESWNVFQEAAISRTAKAKPKEQSPHAAIAHHELTRAHFPPSLQQTRWSLAEIEQKVQDKICERVARATVEKQDAFKIFDRPSKGITKSIFKHKMEKFGLYLTQAEVDALYKRYDSNGDGHIQFKEFMGALMPQDYPPVSNPAVGLSPFLRPSTSAPTLPVRSALPQRAHEWTLQQMKSMLRDKIRARTSNPNVEIQDAFKLFGRPQNGITIDVFSRKLHEFGMDVTAAEASVLFNHYDTNQSGTIGFHELIAGILPKDYTAKTWNVLRDEAMDKQRELLQRRIKYKYERSKLVTSGGARPPRAVLPSIVGSASRITGNG